MRCLGDQQHCELQACSRTGEAEVRKCNAGNTVTGIEGSRVLHALLGAFGLARTGFRVVFVVTEFALMLAWLWCKIS
jgi:hypothetical protein